MRQDSVVFRKSLIPLSFLSLTLFCGFATAQETGTILGTITDPSGASVPATKVTVTNNASGVSRTTVSNQDGNFSLPELNIGQYQLRAEGAGFKAYEQKDITLNVSATVRVNIGLQIGQSQESVTVEANAIQVQSDTSEQSNVITGAQIQNLDTNGRNPVQLATLVPGAASSLPDFNAPTALGSNNNISFNGQRPNHNLWMIDGGETYDRGGGGGMIVSPSPDALGEFRVLASNYSAEYGSASGGTISMAVKSGSRDFHATAWEFNRNDAFDANDYFANLAGSSKPKLRYNAYGFNVSGPVVIPKLYNRDRNKTFFFYNQEWRKLIQGSQIYATAIPAAEFSGNFSGLQTPITVPQTTDPAAIARFAAVGLKPGQAFPGNIIPNSLLDSNVQAFLNTGAIAKPNASGNHFSQAAPVPTNLREEIVKIDHNFSSKFQVMGHLIYDSSQNNYATTLWNTSTYPSIGTLLTAPSYSTVIRATYSISPTAVNELSYNFNGNKINIVPTGDFAKPSGYNVPEYFPSNNLNRLPTVNINSPYNVAYNPGSWPWSNVYSAHQVSDNLSISRGNHNLQFGGTYLRGLKKQDIFGSTNGSYTFDGSYTGNAFSDLLLGYAKNYSELALQDAEDTKFNNIGIYAIDNWRVNGRLTVNLGLRWEGMPHTSDFNNRLANFQANLYNPANRAAFNSDGSLNSNGPGFSTVSGIALSTTPFYLNGVTLAGRNGTPAGVVQNHWNNFGPRVGFAYDLAGDQKTIIRAGFGMFYERVQGNDVYNMGGNPPFSNTPSANNVYFSNPSVNNQTGAGAATPVFPSNLTTLAYSDYKLPTSMQYSFGIQHQLTQSSVLGVSYVGSSNYHQPDSRNINPVALTDTADRLAICGGNCGYTGASVDPNRARLYPGFGTINMTEASTGSSYNSLQVSMNWRNHSGLSLQGAYTYSHELDYVSGDLNSISNPFNRRYDYGSGDFDRTHIAVISYVYELPFAKNINKKFLHSVAGGWSLSGITMFETGTPLTAGLGYDNLGLGGSSNSRPNLVSGISYPQTRTAWFSSSSFSAPAALAFGTESRGSIRGPGRANFNIAVFKSFAIPGREGMRFEFRGETYNTFNHTQFNAINTSFTDSNFGQVTSVYDPRVIQLSGKFYF